MVLNGLTFDITKIVWLDQIRTAFILTSTKEVYALALEEGASVQAFSKLEFPFVVCDISAANNFVVVGQYEGTTDTRDVYCVANFSSFVDSKIVYNNTTEKITAEALHAYLIENVSEDFTLVEDSDLATLTISIPFLSRLVTRPINFIQGSQGDLGALVRVDRATLMVENSGTFTYGTLDGTTYETEFSGLVSKNINVEVPNNAEVETQIVIESQSELPLNIVGMSLRGISYEGA
jgi:hypothetical protein